MHPAFRFACLFALLIPGLLPAQWTPFLSGETHIFSHNESPLFSIRVQQVTGTFPTSTYVLSEELMPASLLSSEPCFSNHSSYDYFAHRAGRFGTQVDQDLLSGNIQFRFPGLDSFQLQLDQPIGATWTFHQASNTTCTRSAAFPTTVLGQPDSAITFLLSIGDSIVLSRQHGILSSPDLRALAHGYWQPHVRFSGLAGLRNANLGPTMPSFQDIYAFQPGDEFEWHTSTWISGGAMISIRLERLRILGPAQHSANTDTIHYLAERSSLLAQISPPDTQYFQPDTLIVTYYRDQGDDLFPLLEGQSGQYRYRQMTDTAFYLESGDHITGTVVPVMTGEFLASGCGDFMEHIWDTYHKTGYAPGLGAVWQDTYSIFTTHRRMSCYRKNGILHGTCPDWSPFLTSRGAPTSTAPLSVSLSPNPAHSEVKVQATQPFPRGSTWTLSDLSGKALLQGACPASTSWQIPLHDLSPGLYIFQTGGSTHKVIKAH